MSDKVVLAYSGGLDTSAAIKWIKEHYDLDVIALTVDVGNETGLLGHQGQGPQGGRRQGLVMDAAGGVRLPDTSSPPCRPAPSTRASTRWPPPWPGPLIAKLLVDVARDEGADAVAHGCTGKGNDQVRFDVGVTDARARTCESSPRPASGA